MARKNPNSMIRVIPQIPIKDERHLNEYLNTLLNKKAEGLIIRNPKKEFHTGRSAFILKVKKST